VGTTERARYTALAAGLVLYLVGYIGAVADPPAGKEAAGSPGSSTSDAPQSLPQDGFFSSLKQTLKQGYDQEAVRGHFDLGSTPNVRRYYCLVDIKTGQREPNAVVGEPIPMAGGLTGIKSSAVSFYRCAAAEQQGMLVTTGYVLSGPAAKITPAPQAPAPQAPTPQQAPPPPGPSPDAVNVSLEQIDIAGVKLGMSPDEVRAVLRSKKLLDYNESAETLSYMDPGKGIVQQVPNGRFVNVIAAWSAPPATTRDNFEVDGESYEIMFTPVPGRERAMGIVHSVGYSLPNAVHESVLESGLIKKYGGFNESGDLPESPTWRIQSAGNVQVGDSCNRRGIFGGLGSLDVTKVRENIALKRAADDFRSQVERCGVALMTEDHHTANGGALREDRLVTRFTVTAYSPAIGLEGAKAAAQLIQAAVGPGKKSDATRAKEQSAPSL
jgi:hypothetical protein